MHDPARRVLLLAGVITTALGALGIVYWLWPHDHAGAWQNLALLSPPACALGVLPAWALGSSSARLCGRTAVGRVNSSRGAGALPPIRCSEQ